MTPHRTPDLAAECDALRAENARLRAKLRPPMRLVLRPGWQPLALIIAFNATSTALYLAVRPWSPWRAFDLGCLALSVTCWTWAFVRRVPAEGSTR